MNSEKYDAIILNNIDVFLTANRSRGFVWMQDNASCHRSKFTQESIRRRRIPNIQWPRYSPDLNLIEHIWSWIKNYIQARYCAAYYDASKIPLTQLRAIIWEAVPAEYIETIYNS